MGIKTERKSRFSGKKYFQTKMDPDEL